MLTKAKKPLTPAEQQQASRERWDWQAQQQAQFELDKQARQAEDAAFLQRVESARQARAAAIEQGIELEPPVIPTINGYYDALAASEQAERDRLEAERIANTSERDRFISALSYQTKLRISKWESLHPGEEFPLSALQF